MAVLSDGQIEVGALVIGAGTSYRLDHVGGLGIPEMRTSDADNPGRHGILLGNDFVGGRTIDISGYIEATTQASALEKAATLAQNWNTVDGDPSFRLKWPGRATKFAVGRPRRCYIDPDLLKFKHVTFTLEYRCSDPRFYLDSGDNQVNIAFNAGQVNVATGGAFPTPLRAIFYGPFDSGARLIDDVKGTALQLNVAVANGDTVTIDTATRTVSRGGASGYANYYQYLYGKWGITDIAPRTPTMSLRATATGTGGASKVVAQYRDAWMVP